MYNDGKLDSLHGWSAGASDVHQWMEIDVLNLQPIAGIVTQGVYVHTMLYMDECACSRTV